MLQVWNYQETYKLQLNARQLLARAEKVDWKAKLFAKTFAKTVLIKFNNTKIPSSDS